MMQTQAKPSVPPPENYLTTAVAAAMQAGSAVMDVYETDFAVDFKSDQSPLTLADRRSHEIITDRLRRFDIPVLSEEGKSIPYAERRRWQTLWVVDPLDGTKEFVKRNGEFTVNIALVKSGRPVMGVVFAPERRRLFFADSGSGAFLMEKEDNLRRLNRLLTAKGTLQEMKTLAVRLPSAPDGSRPYTIVGSRSHATPDLENFVAEKRRQYPSVAFIPAGSSLKICLVAEGRADVYPRLGPTMEWDTAAGHAVAEAAGASIRTYPDGMPLRYNRKKLLNPWFIVSR